MKKILIYVLFSLSLFSAGIWKTVEMTDWEQEYRYQHKIKKITFSSKNYTKSRDSMLRYKDTKEV